MEERAQPRRRRGAAVDQRVACTAGYIGGGGGGEAFSAPAARYEIQKHDRSRAVADGEHFPIVVAGACRVRNRRFRWVSARLSSLPFPRSTCRATSLPSDAPREGGEPETGSVPTGEQPVRRLFGARGGVLEHSLSLCAKHGAPGRRHHGRETREHFQNLADDAGLDAPKGRI